MKFLATLNWTLWSALLVAIIYALVTILTERSRSPEAGPALGAFLLALGFSFSAATGALLHRFVQKQSLPWLIVMLLVLAWPLIPLVARPIGLAIKDWKYAREKTALETRPTL